MAWLRGGKLPGDFERSCGKREGKKATRGGGVRMGEILINSQIKETKLTAGGERGRGEAEDKIFSR